MNSVSIGIPTYNGEKFVADAIESAVNQSMAVNEIFIVDDASTDATALVVKKMADKYNSRTIRFIKNEKNSGYQVNWNRCFENCNTRYLIILHQDDVLKNNAVEKLRKYFNTHPDVAVVGGREDTMDEEAKITKEKETGESVKYSKGEVYEFISGHGTYIPCSSVMFDMEKIVHVGYFETNVLATDELYWAKVLTKYPIALLGSSIINRRNHPGQAEWNDFKNKPKEIAGAYRQFVMLDRYEERKKYKKQIRKIIKQKFSKSLTGIAGSVIRYHHDGMLSLWYIGQALKIDPLLPLKKQIFWKVMLIGLLNSMGVLKPLRETRKRLLKNGKQNSTPNEVTASFSNDQLLEAPLVSILVITFNHEHFISECLNSLLNQQVDFSMEISVGVDFSSDRTMEIVEEYQQKYPDVINILAYKKRVGPVENGIAAIKSCKGKYLSICDGDDYWNDPHKLKKQVSFLESHPEYGLVYSDIHKIDDKGQPIKEEEEVWEKEKKYKSGHVFWDLLKNCFINTNTVLVRKNIMDNLLHKDRFDIHEKWFIYDYWFWLNITKNYKVKFLPEKLATYRVHSESLSRVQNFYSKRALKVKLDVFSNLDKHNVKTRREKNVVGGTLALMLISKNFKISERLRIIKLILIYPPAPWYLIDKVKKKYLKVSSSSV